jgi:hypothetical protein
MINIYHFDRLLVSYQSEENLNIQLSKYLAENYNTIRRKAVSIHSNANSYFFKKLREKKQDYLTLILQNGYEFSPFKGGDLYKICIKIALDEIDFEYKNNIKKYCHKEFNDINVDKLRKNSCIKFNFGLIDYLTSTLKLIILFTNFLLINGRINHGHKKNINSYDCLFVEYFLNFDIRKNNGKSKYFSKQTSSFIEDVADENSTCRIQLYTNISPFYKINRDLKSIFSDVDNIYSIYQFSNRWDIISDLICSVKLYAAYKSILKRIPDEYKVIYNQRFQIHNFFIDYYHIKSLERAINGFNGKNIYCVSECQSWEFALISNLSISKPNIRKNIIFYVHAPIRTWDFRFHTIKSKLEPFDLGCKENISVQYHLMCDSDFKFFNSLNLKNVNIKTQKAFRYKYLNRIEFKYGDEYIRSKIVVGIIFDYSALNAEKLIDVINKFCHKYYGIYTFITKFHPANSESLTAKTNAIADKFNGDMLSFLDHCSYVICSPSTSSSIDANYCGITCFTFLWTGLNLNSFDNLLNKSFGNEDELYYLLNSISVGKSNEYKYVRNALGLYF